MNASPQISILIISYNTRELTLSCIRSILAETNKTPFELIVVDNASCDGSAEAIRAEYQDIEVVSLNENIGFARANNLAALRARGELLLLLNPDTVVLNGAVDRLVEFARTHPDAGVWGGRTLNDKGSLNPESCWGDMTIWSLVLRIFGVSSIFAQSPFLNPEAYGGWNRDSIREVDIVSGCFLLIAKDLWNKLGGFDPRFYMYGEEADLCLRARQAGARPTLTPTAEIIHFGGMSDTVTANKIERLLIAKLTLALKHWSAPRRRMARTLFLALVATRAAGYSAFAKVARRPGVKDTASAWRGVWSKRQVWIKGYPLA